MKNWKRRHTQLLVASLLAMIVVSIAACGGDSELTAVRGYDPTPTVTP